MPIRLSQVPAGWFVLDGEKTDGDRSTSANMRDILRLEQGGAARRKERVLTITDIARAGEWFSYYVFSDLQAEYARKRRVNGGETTHGSIIYDSRLNVSRVCIVDNDALRITYIDDSGVEEDVTVRDLRQFKVSGHPNHAIGAVEFYHPERPPIKP